MADLRSILTEDWQALGNYNSERSQNEVHFLGALNTYVAVPLLGYVYSMIIVADR